MRWPMPVSSRSAAPDQASSTGSPLPVPSSHPSSNSSVSGTRLLGRRRREGATAVLVAWWRGDVDVARARRGGLTVEGRAALVRTLPGPVRALCAGRDPTCVPCPVACSLTTMAERRGNCCKICNGSTQGGREISRDVEHFNSMWSSPSATREVAPQPTEMHARQLPRRLPRSSLHLTCARTAAGSVAGRGDRRRWRSCPHRRPASMALRAGGEDQPAPRLTSQQAECHAAPVGGPRIDRLQVPGDDRAACGGC
jgi:hypothetical protein